MVAAVSTAAQGGARHDIVWTGATTAGNATNTAAALPVAGAFGAVQVTGTFGGATVTLEKSNDGTNWVALSDLDGDAISKTSTGMSEFTTAAAYIRPQVAGGTGDTLTVRVVVWSE